jgi:lincosamide nucleotidyltransferase
VRSWVEQVAPVSLLVVNEFGTHVAIFENLVRGEFHFASAAEIDTVRSWPGVSAPIDEMIIVDRRGLLTLALRSLAGRSPVPSAQGEIEQLCGRFVVWMVSGWQVLQRGEVVRASQVLNEVHRYLLWMARLTADSTAPAW